MSRRIGVRGSGIGRHSSVGKYGWLLGLLILICTPFVLLFGNPQCQHEEVIRYVFTAPKSTAHNSVCRYCSKCDERLSEYSLFKGELVDKSYLEAIKEHSDGSEILPGEYYTVTATVPMGLAGICEVENEDYIVRFHVDFRDEFRESVNSIEDDAEITFRGRYYDTGCGFTDCELLSISSNEA